MALNFPEIDPIAIHITENIGVRWYALAYLVGILFGWVYALNLVGNNKAERPNREDIDNVITWLVLGVVLGGRIGYVLFYNFSEYIHNPLEILYIWQGGMSFHGGLIGVVTAIVLYSRLNKIPVLALGDIIAVIAPIGLFFGRIANFINGELYGRIADVPWAVYFPYGGDYPRHPSQIYESLLEGALMFYILKLASKNEKIRSKNGFLTGIFIAGYGMCRFVVEFFREPDVQIGFVFKYFSMGQLLSLPMVIIGLLVIEYSIHKFGRIKKNG